MNPTPTTARLVLRAPGPSEPLRTGRARADPSSLADLFASHYQELYRYCRSILHHDEDARDALQSALAKAWAAAAREERDFEIRPWLFRIAHNEAISVLRARRWSDQREPERLPEAASRSLPETLEDRARIRELREDLADLPERQRSALVLRELNGLGHEEIAAVIGGTARAAKQTIFEARRALLECGEGRDMRCEDVQRTLSDGDGRVLRGRRIRGHLRGCAVCSGFAAAIDRRTADLRVLCPPLPAAAGGALLAKAVGAGALGGGAAGGAGTASGGAGLAGLVGGATAKAVAVVAITGALGGVAAVRHLTTPASRPAVRHQAAPAQPLPRRTAATPEPAPAPVRTASARRRTTAKASSPRIAPPAVRPASVRHGARRSAVVVPASPDHQAAAVPPRGDAKGGGSSRSARTHPAAPSQSHRPTSRPSGHPDHGSPPAGAGGARGHSGAAHGRPAGVLPDPGRGKALNGQ